MYLKHFQLKELPFTLTPNVNFFYKLAGHHTAYNTVILNLRNGEGFIKITGKVGSGKTLLCRMLLEKLGDKFYTAYIPNPELEPASLRKALARELGIQGINYYNQHKLLDSIEKRLTELHQSGRRVVLIIDEAQALPTESLETLRLLTNLETATTKLLQVVLLGQPELDERLNQGSLRQLKQRIGFSYHLPLMKRQELAPYINHRLAAAGYHGKYLFTPMAQRLLFNKTKGVPRLINILCHKAMMCAFGKGKRRVTYSCVKKAIKDTESISNTRWPSVIITISILIAILAGIFLTHWSI